ncbi:hypothetical protein FNF29_07625 [Cafeteria roenbergensis]|uniref:Succinate dehydrogenase cytochrome b560 subunit, mitochondrial n=1 Tax=Cafeteria roenbergensis TaxID=33653 RepID=A0A5A8C261_CAFRO|nr:hypothetical protein FNF29_07625 [Cafeteria roenbergensis]KAA0155059.1 hypothetical protein FNF31_06127 [Cafeteria roenbergensis]|eukprot:KAA0146998.1 hypothetical protein FNF29_07625 [Cafeteria roenbergensis]
MALARGSSVARAAAQAAAAQGGVLARAAAAAQPLREASSAASKRPLSPHLTIYKFTPNMISSTTFRGTGIAMTVGTAAGAIALMATGAQAESAFMVVQESMLLKPLVKAAIAFPLTFHFLGGIRHLAWDSLWGFDQPTITSSAWGILYGSAGLTALLAFAEFEE